MAGVGDKLALNVERLFQAVEQAVEGAPQLKRLLRFIGINIQALAQYARINDVNGCSLDCSATKANSYMVGAKYLLSKRTGVYATFNQIKNDTKGLSDFTNGGGYTPANAANATGVLTNAISLTGNGTATTTSTGLAPANAGADPRVIALGIIHNF